MRYALDAVLLCVFLLFTFIGVRRGFVRSAVHFLGSVLSALLASALGGAVAQWVYDGLFRQALVEKVEESVSSLGGQDAAAAIQGFFSGLPDFLVRALEEAGVTVSSLAGALSAQSGRAAEAVADALSPVFVGFLKVLAVIVLFFLFMMLVRLAADLLGRVFHLPLLRQLNGILGGVFGFLLALVSAWVAVSALQVFAPMLASDARETVQQALAASMLAGFLVKSNPFGFLFR